MFGKQQFVTGCNYWASHAGIDMWKKWDANTVEEDFAKMESIHLEMVRCFPLWPDFQPEDLDAAIMEFNRRNRRFGGA